MYRIKQKKYREKPFIVLLGIHLLDLSLLIPDNSMH